MRVCLSLSVLINVRFKRFAFDSTAAVTGVIGLVASHFVFIINSFLTFSECIIYLFV